MKYYVNPYPNPRAADGETSGYWQHRSQVFGKPILNPNPEKVDLDGDGIVEALQQSEHANPIASESGLVRFAGRKINFDKDASKIPTLEQLPSLAFGRTTQRGVSIGTIGEDENQRGTKNKSQTEVGDGAGQDNREASTAGLVSLSAPKETSQDNNGATLSVTRVKGQPRGESDLFNARQAGASGFSIGRTPGMVVTRGERKISYDGINFTPWEEGTPQPMPRESKPSTTIIIRAASFEARQPAGLTRNAFGQPIPRPRFTSVSHTVGGSSSGGSSNSQVRAGRTRGGGARIQVSPRASSSSGTSGGGVRVQVAPRASSSRKASGGGQRVQWARG